MIPARYFWPGFIIALLSLSITVSFTVLYFATSDGGPQVIPDYYEKSVTYDDIYRARQAAIELGWEVDVELEGHRGKLRVVDRQGEPVEGGEGTVTFYRPSLAEPVATVELIERGDEPGVYEFEDVADLHGYWDLDIDVERGDEVFTVLLRTSVPEA